MKLADSKVIREMDRAASERYGIGGLVLMENAGRGVADAILRELPALGSRRVSIIAGKGNNGGDGFVAARHLVNAGIDTRVYLLSRLDELKGDAAVNARIWQRMGKEVFEIASSEELSRAALPIRHSAVVVDALFGTGLSSPVTGLYAEAIALMNSSGRKIIAVDIPSGIDAGSGAVLGCAAKADITVTMAMPKAGLYAYPGREYAGRVEVVDIGAPRVLVDDPSIRWNLITEAGIRTILKPRARAAHKGACGHTLVVAGSPGYSGAAYLASMGALRIGSGLVTIGIPRGLNPVMEVKTTEAMTRPLPETSEGTLGEVSVDEALKVSEGKDSAVIGPGLGTAVEASRFIERFIEASTLPLVVDADALSAFAGRAGELRKGPQKVLTPHPGEMARLLSITIKDVQSDRFGSAERLAEETGAVVALKGASTVVASPDGQVYINATGNPGLATGGTGDVLAGMTGGLMAQGYSTLDAALAAVYLHGLAADIYRDRNGEAGLIASDLLPIIPGLIHSIVS